MDVYSLSRESIQRMLPAQSQPNGNANGTSQPPAPPADSRQFQYRFSMQYVRNLPEAQRPVEREVFGESFLHSGLGDLTVTGPFSATQLRGWRNTGFFGGPASENVELRLLSDGTTGQWGSWATIVEP